MMNSTFSIFDPMSSLMNWNLNWISTLLGLMFLPKIYWFNTSRYMILWLSISKTLHSELNILLGKNKMTKGMTLIFFTIFTFILFNNFLGLLPYIFTSTSHLSLSLSISLPLWISLMLFGWINNTNHMFTHLIPQGTPFILMPFMVLIETTSNVIRSMTLSVRLTANMIAGHLLMSLLSNNGVLLNLPSLSILITTQFFLLILESAVAIIQSYVFMVLSTLYSSEVN
uniref:ATP synthase F0 subunit 6 n=1 Tax=Dentathalia scutellariae TaxID=1170499 RepID=UPI00220F86CB|nr:ATP synthase F0 subunit 6 [Dentathalia scutellariae]UXW93338.1 ATP synthase F0 subunit 6 [Dentathalia scutellariae]